MGSNYQKSLAITFVCAFLILGAVAFLSYRNMSAMIEANHWVKHSQDIIKELESVIDAVKTLEVSEQGFTVTVDENYLKSYEEGVSEAAFSLDRLNALTKDEQDKQNQIRHLRLVMDELLSYTRQDMTNKVPGR